MALNSIRPVYGNTMVASFKVNASTAINEGELVTFAVSTGLITAAADSCTTGVIGVAAASGAVSTFIPVYLNGVFEGTAASGVNFAPAAVCYVAASQELDAGSMSDVSIGIVVDTDPASAGKVRFILQPSTVAANTLHVPVTHA